MQSYASSNLWAYPRYNHFHHFLAGTCITKLIRNQVFGVVRLAHREVSTGRPLFLLESLSALYQSGQRTRDIYRTISMAGHNQSMIFTKFGQKLSLHNNNLRL